VRRIASIMAALGLITTLLCTGCFSTTAFPIENQVVVKRIVSLKPNITEILFALGVGNQVVGVTTWCNQPIAARALPKVADYLRPFPEQLLAVHPDLVMGSEENSAKNATLQLQKLGLQTAFFSFKTLEDMYQSIQKIGDQVGRPKEAARLVKDMHTQMNKIPKAHDQNALIVVGYRPLIVVGAQTFLGEVLSALGVQNVMGNTPLPYPHLNTETLLKLNPTIIIDITMGTERSQQFWNQFPMLSAVKHNRIISLNMDDFRPGPRLPAAAMQLAKQL